MTSTGFRATINRLPSLCKLIAVLLTLQLAFHEDLTKIPPLLPLFKYQTFGHIG